MRNSASVTVCVSAWPRTKMFGTTASAAMSGRITVTRNWIGSATTKAMRSAEREAITFGEYSPNSVEISGMAIRPTRKPQRLPNISEVITAPVVEMRNTNTFCITTTTPKNVSCWLFSRSSARARRLPPSAAARTRMRFDPTTAISMAFTIA